MDDIRKERAVAKGCFHRKLTTLKSKIESNTPVIILDKILGEVESALSKVEIANNKLFDFVDTEEDISEIHDYIRELEVKYVEVSSVLVNKKQNTEPSKLQIKSESAISEKGCDKIRFLVKKLPPPTFNGDIRQYPTFKTDFERLMIPQYGKDGYILKQCLTGTALEVISGLDDFDQMFSRLDIRFGSSSRIVDAILSDIRSLKVVSEGNHVKLLELIKTVERCWNDLIKLNKQDEIENTTMVTLIEKLLPETLKHDWAVQRQKITNDKIVFQELMKFLQNERSVIEYMDDNIRKGTCHKANVHNTIMGDDSKYIEVFREMQKDQERQNQHVVECLTSISNVLNTLTVNKQTFKDNFRTCALHNTNSHNLSECSVFKGYDNRKKFEFIKGSGICFICLTSGHVANQCIRYKKCEVLNAMGSTCNGPHHPMLHEMFQTNFGSKMNSNLQNNMINRKGVLLPVGNVKHKGLSIATLYDSGANLSMITHSMARKLGLQGNEIEILITKVGNVMEKMKTRCYIIRLRDLNGNEWPIELCGIDEITNEVNVVNMDNISELFNINEKEINRPSGKIEMLIGSDYCAFMPQVISSKGNLQLLQNQFGYVVRGSPKSFFVRENAGFVINHFACYTTDDIIIPPKHKISKQLENYFEYESLGTDCQPKCGGCRCGKCNLTSKFSFQEERELSAITEGLHYDSSKKTWTATYPWVKDPRELPNNYSLAYARLKSTEKRLKNLGTEYTKMYANQIDDMINRGIAIRLSEEEVQNYKGPIFYLPHHEVHKPSSRSTPLRIVFNSSSSFGGHSLNDYLAKGADVLNSLLGVLLKFRLDKIAVLGDIKKMYNSVCISETDMHCHRFLWRNMDETRKPDHYILKTVTFGDKPSGAIAMLALRKTAEMNLNYPEASDIIINSSYVDDLIFSTNSIEKAKELTKEIEMILQEGGFNIKEWIMSGTDNGNTNSSESVLLEDDERVLGLMWNQGLDVFKFAVKINLPGFKTVSNEMQSNLIEVVDFPKVLTKRMILSQISTLYDPLGMLVPFTLKSKLLMRETVCSGTSINEVNNDKLDWDKPVNHELYLKWKFYFHKMCVLSKLEFPRCIKPVGAMGKPSLIIFSDGSKNAFGSVAYIRYQIDANRFMCNLIMAKNRIAPRNQISIPRLELCGCVLSVRLRQIIEAETKLDFDFVAHITDSSIVLSQIKKDSFKFNTFVANRVAEIQRKSALTDWYWTSSENNIADLTTRECKVEQLDVNSSWQIGPEFLTLPVNQWPVSQNTQIEKDLPDLITRFKINVCLTNSGFDIDIDRFSSYRKLLNVTARILNVKKYKSLKAILKEPSTSDIEESEMFWVKQVQMNIGDDWKIRYKRLGPKMNELGIITVGNRIEYWLKANYDQHEIPLLVAEHPFTRLYINSIHNRDHLGIDSTLAKLSTKFWVPKSRKIIKSIKAKCVICRKLERKCESQCMGPMPDFRMNPTPPFYRISLDLFGPILIKDAVKKRTTKKVFGVIFTCFVTRAVHLDLTEGYDRNNFLITLRRFISIRGYPRHIHSDNGSQLVAADRELRSNLKHWDSKELGKFGREKGVNWTFNRSADAPHQNGCSESLIKSVKRILYFSISNSVLSFGELQTVLYEISNLLNDRPIGLKPQTDIELGNYLCPNDLLLGRTNNRAPIGIWDEDANYHRRYEHLNKIVINFWKKWNRDFFSTLLIRQKWHVERRNIQVGDIVILKDTSLPKGTWKLAQISETHPSIDGKVRNVTVRYKLCKPGKYKGEKDLTVNRSIHNIIVLLPVEEFM